MMSYTVTITKRDTLDPVDAQHATDVEIFRQTVEVIDMQAVFSAVNKKPRKPRERKAAAAKAVTT